MRPIDVTAPARLAHLTKEGRGYPILATVSRSRSGVDFGVHRSRLGWTPDRQGGT